MIIQIKWPRRGTAGGKERDPGAEGGRRSYMTCHAR